MWKMYFSREAICILFWNAPKSNTFIFGSFFHLQTSHVFFLWNAPIFYVRIFWNAPFFPFSEWKRKNGAFQRKNTWLIWKREINRKWKSSILGHFKIKCIWPHVKNTSFTLFLGHFLVPRVYFNRILWFTIFCWLNFYSLLCCRAFDRFSFSRLATNPGWYLSVNSGKSFILKMISVDFDRFDNFENT